MRIYITIQWLTVMLMLLFGVVCGAWYYATWVIRQRLELARDREGFLARMSEEADARAELAVQRAQAAEAKAALSEEQVQIAKLEARYAERRLSATEPLVIYWEGALRNIVDELKAARERSTEASVGWDELATKLDDAVELLRTQRQAGGSVANLFFHDLVGLDPDVAFRPEYRA